MAVSPDTGDTKDCKNVDSGYAWVILVCSFMLQYFQGVSLGTSLSVGVFYTEWLAFFGDNHASTAWIGAINIGFTFGFGPVSSLLTRKYGNRHVAFMGGIFSSVGLIASSFAQNIWHLYLTYGIITGMGFSAVFLPSNIICNEYFDRLKPQAIGIASCGTGLFNLGLPVVAGLLIEYSGWRVAMTFLAALCMQGCLCAYLLFPSSFWRSESQTFEDQNDTSTNEITFSGYNSYARSLFVGKNFRLLLFTMNNFLWNVSVMNMFVFVVDYVYIQGISKDTGGLLISLIGLSSIVGRIASGMLGNILDIRCLTMFNVSTAVTGFAMSLLPIFTSFTSLACLCAVYGLGYGGQIGTILLTLIELFGIGQLATSFALSLVFQALGALSGPPLGGFLYEVTQDYSAVFYFGGGMSLLSVIVACIIPCTEKK